MCGICGFVSKRNIKHEELIRINDSMAHRGPDDCGAEIADGKNGFRIGLAHRRLSVIDLSPLGHQPMHSSDGRIAVVFNGEIYNFLELKKELKDYSFQSSCDTEVIIASYLKWGGNGSDKWIKKLQGMFSIALYDRDTQKIYLVRDRMGKKPLYYWLDGENIVFSSELKPIILCPGFKQKINTEIIPRFLFQQYINPPDTIFKDVYQLEPGSVGVFSNGSLSIHKYWNIKEQYHKYSAQAVTDYEEAKDELKKLIHGAVKKRMISDVPLGTFLSGGYDSSIISAVAQEISETPINTFSIGFSDERYNEAVYAKEISKYLGTKHTELYLDEKDMFDLVDSIPLYFDQPFADSSQIPTMLVSKVAKQKVTVALSGDGGDELFCGYTSYDSALIAQKYDRIGQILYWLGQIGMGSYRIKALYPTKVKAVSENRDLRYKTQFGAGTYANAIRSMILPDRGYTELKYDLESSYGVEDWQIRRMLLDMDTYLPGDILTKVDRASMKYSLESRCPLLDTDVVCYSFQIPHEFKYMKGDKKHILKDIAKDYIPGELLDRPKQGFSIPINGWLMGGLKERLESYASEGYLRKQGIFNPEYTHKLVRRYLSEGDQGAATGNNFSRICWPFFIFQQWYEYYIS